MMDFLEIRRTVIVAMFSDDTLMEMFVLKGGNALNIVHGISPRTSIDVDLSIAGDFPDIGDARERVRRALTDRFESRGYAIFDYSFEPRPRKDIERRDDRWGGYRVEFKLLPLSKAGLSDSNLSLAQRSAVAVGPNYSRTFRVEISKYEYCDEKIAVPLDDYLVYVYPPFLVAAEKLRALCQQMPEYAGRRKVTARARDFYDIHAIVTHAEYRHPPDFGDTLRNVFEAKEVPLALLELLDTTREFHRADWKSVADAVGSGVQPFDFYFDFVVSWVRGLRIP